MIIKKAFVLFIGVVLSISIHAQQDDKPIRDVSVGGFVQYSMYTDTYASVDTRDGVFNLFPKAPEYDSNGVDLNENFQFQMAAFQARLNIKATGPDVLGAKTFAMIEGDFLGTSQDYVRMLRIRHAFVRLDWPKSSLLLGQYWHPVWNTKCYPKALSHGAGTPFHPLNRSPQIRFTFKPTENISLLFAAVTFGYHKSKGPANAQRNSGIPEFVSQLEYQNNSFLIGAAGGYKVLKPRLVTENNFQTNKTIGSFNIEAYAKIETKNLAIRGEVLYGENITHFVMIGGYGAKQDPTSNDDYDYANLKTMATWMDVETKLGPVKAGVILGYSKNMGSNDTYYSLRYGRGEDIDYIYRFSPRLFKTWDKLLVGIEYMLTGAVYGIGFDEKFNVKESTDQLNNHRILFTTKYSF